MAWVFRPSHVRSPSLQEQRPESTRLRKATQEELLRHDKAVDQRKKGFKLNRSSNKKRRRRLRISGAFVNPPNPAGAGRAGGGPAVLGLVTGDEGGSQHQDMTCQGSLCSLRIADLYGIMGQGGQG